MRLNKIVLLQNYEIILNPLSSNRSVELIVLAPVRIMNLFAQLPKHLTDITYVYSIKICYSYPST